MATRSSSFRAVVMTNRLAQWGGAEIVTCEYAEEFARRGLNVTVYAHFVSPEITAILAESGVKATSDPDAVTVMDSDIVYSHHQIASLLLAREAGRAGALRGHCPLFCYNHLSPYEPLEAPGPFVERKLADHIWCNSNETKAMLAGYGAPFDVAQVVPNPAPDAFFKVRAPGATRLSSVLVVSNHVPPELETALDLLKRQSVRVSRIGMPVVQRRIEPADILGHDAVITIGKTVQFALASRTPVFCYDRFGGPGWLTGDTFSAAEATNFSGRSKPEKLSPETLVSDIQAGFAAARDWVAGLNDTTLANWRLRDYVEILISSATAALNDDSRQERCRRVIESEGFLRGLKIEGNIQQSLRTEVTARFELEQGLRAEATARIALERKLKSAAGRSFFSRLNRAIRGRDL